MPEQGSIDLLKAAISGRNGIVRPSRFSVMITPPSNVSVSRDLNLLCETAPIPSRKISTSDYTSYRNPFKVPTGFTYDDVTLTFLLTGDYYAKSLFDRWSASIVDVPSYRVKYTDSFSGRVQITQLDDALEPIYRITFNDAFPNTVGELALNSGSLNETMKLSVTFSYYDYTIEDYSALN